MLRSHFVAGLGASSVALGTVQNTAISTIAVVGPFSGADRHLGEDLANGVRGALDDANRLRGPLDPTFAVRTFDDQNSVAIALQNAAFAMGDSSVIGVIGHVSSRATIAALPTYASALMPLISPVCTDDRLTASNYRNVFRLQTKDSDEGRLFARAVIAQKHPKNPYVFVQDGDYGADVANGFINTMRQSKIPAQYSQFPYEKPDFAGVAATALLTNPDYAFLAGTVGDMGPLVAVLRDKGYTGPIGASQGFFDGATARLGAAANDMQISTSMPYLALAPTTISIRTDYAVRYGPLSPICAFGYAAAQIFVQTIRRVNATARNTLLSAMLQGGPVSTLVGTFTFLAGEPIDPEIYFYTVKDGNFSYVRQAHPSPFMVR